MKTLKELNSKWYWRFIKVIWFILIWFVFIAIFVFLYDYLQGYNPKNIEAADSEIKSTWVLNITERAKETFTEETIKLSDLPKIITKKDLIINQEKQVAQLLVVAESVGKKIDRIRICEEFSIWCNYDGVNSVWNYIQNAIYSTNYETSVITISKTLYLKTKEDFNEDYRVANEAVEKIEKIKSWKSSWESFYDFQKSTGKDIHEVIGSRDYLWFIGILYLIIYSVLTLGLLFFISVGIQRVGYYIILGAFKPKL